MNLPNIPQAKLVNEDGVMGDEWMGFIIQLLQYMNTNLGGSGFVMPSLTTANIALLTNAQNGTIVYDETTEQFKGKENGTFKVFTLV